MRVNTNKQYQHKSQITQLMGTWVLSTSAAQFSYFARFVPHPGISVGKMSVRK